MESASVLMLKIFKGLYMFGIFKRKSKNGSSPVIKTPENVFYTNSGMLGLWDYSAYQHIKNYDAWEPEFVEDEDILRNIKNATYVPINIQSDGAYSVEVKLNEATELSSREQKYLTVTSQPYLLKTEGKVALSSMETVGNDPVENIKILSVDPGEYAVQIHLIGWDKEPGSKGADGAPSDNALPDFIVCISRNDGQLKQFRQEIETFRRQDIVD